MADRKPLYINSSGVKTVFQTGDTLGIVNGGTGATDAPNARINLGLQIGTNVQAWDADLDALAAFAGTGFAIRTASNTWAQRSLAAPAAGFTITNSDGVAGNPTFVLANDLGALEALASTGIAVRTGTDTWAQRAVQGTAGRIVLTNGNGVSGDPTIDLATVSNSGTGTFVKVNIDSYGRVTGTAAVAAADITTLVDATYVNVNGDTMTGFLTLNADPSSALHAATKQYVDGVAAGLSYKDSVKAATTAVLTITARTATTITIGGTTLTVDGQTMANGDRMLVKDATTGVAGAGTADNGIYTVGGIGSSVVLTRSTDADTTGELGGGDTVWVNQGTVQADTAWTITTDGAITIGTTGITWTQTSGLGQVIAGNGLTKTGNQLDIGTASSARIVVNADNIDLATVSVSAGGTFLKFLTDSYGRVIQTNPVLASDISALLDADLNAIAALPSTGIAVRTAADTWAQRTILGTAGRVAVTNGDGVAGNPAIDLASGVATPGTYSSVTVDTYGRVTAGTNPFTDKIIIAEINAQGSTINKCQVVYASAAGSIALARADVLTTAKMIGLVFDTTIANTASGNIITDGSLTATTTQWDAVTGGTGGLTTGSIYYLSTATAGALTTTAPTTGYLVPVGIGLSTTVMRLYSPDLVQL